MIPAIPPDHDETQRAQTKLAAVKTAARRRRRRRRVALGAATGIACAAVAVAVWLVPSGRPSEVQLVGPPTTSTIPSTTTAPSKPSTGNLVGPWDARTVGGPAGHGTPLAGTSSSLYVADGKAILRVDPATGAVLATRAVSSEAAGTAVIVGHALWTANATANGNLHLRSLNLTTLAPEASITVAPPRGARAHNPVALTANTHDQRLYVAIGDTVTVIDAANHRATHHYAVTGAPIGRLAVNPADTKLYVDHFSNAPDRVTVVDPNDGAVVASPIQMPGGLGIYSIAASPGGLWVATGGGMGEWIEFIANSKAPQQHAPLTSGGGGLPVTSTITGNVVWLGGTSKVVCADPVTGAVRASAPVPTPSNDAANITFLTPAGGHLFANYFAAAGPSHYLIELTPPARCTPTSP
ncbi:MAG: hypothetical protein M0Z42_14985 [Actinomycetota bacterium]|jgi:DNA-binding beta-propeller fold protein YncE|nr:hypothetical protein [Actinomycetota bacterium]